MAEILPLLANDRNRTLLADWLAADHQLVEPDADNPLDTPFDLCLVDTHALTRHRDRIVKRREEASPEYLPFLLVTQSEQRLTSDVWDAVDDVVELPSPKHQLRARIETQLRTRSLSLELKRRTERLDQFASLLSHDLRNPLSVARGNLQAARATGKEARFDQTEEALDRMDEIIENALTLARQGAKAVDDRPISLAAAAEHAWKMVETGDATLTVEDKSLVADPSFLEELLENLYRNSIEHGGPDVTVRVGPTDGGFVVADDGAGFPESLRETAFEMGTTTGEGTGLGLSIVEGIADAHGWHVTLEDAKTGGTRFEFTGVETP